MAGSPALPAFFVLPRGKDDHLQPKQNSALYEKIKKSEKKVDISYHPSWCRPSNTSIQIGRIHHKMHMSRC